VGFEQPASGASVSADEFLAGRKARSLELTARAGELWESRTEDNIEAVSAIYRKAIDQDPANGAAFIGIANSLVLSALIGGLRGGAAYPRAAEAVKRAQRLGCEGPDARCAAAWLEMAYERKWKRAREGFELALKHQPRSSHALCGRALLCVAEGNLADAALLLFDAWKQNAFASTATTFLAWIQYLDGESDRALSTIAEARASGEDGAAISAIECFALLGPGSGESKLRRIESIAAAHPRCLAIQGALGCAWAAADRTGQARDILNNLKRMPGGCSYAAALVLCALEEKYAAVSCLETSYTEGSLWSLGFGSDPLLQTLRDDAKVASRLRRLGPQE
jgi:tetratricopeptide (TPR) repeat protein